MGAIVGIDDRVIFTTNWEWECAGNDALIVAKAIATTPPEQSFVEKFEQSQRGLFSGYCPDFERLFPSLIEQKFWVRCFRDAARWLQLGRIPNEGPDSAARRIFIAYWCADILKALVYRLDDIWIADDEDSLLRFNTRGAESVDEYRDMQRRCWAKRQSEADDRGVIKADLLPDGRVACPYCLRRFSLTDEHSWDGERHRDCLTKLEIQTSKDS